MRSVLLQLARVSACLFILSALLHALRYFHALPPYFPGGDLEPLVVAYQSNAAAQSGSENLLLTGDSSCLMGVSVPRLEAADTNEITAINLGTLSYLPLQFFGKLAAQRAAASRNPNPVIVLLINPEMLTVDIDATTAAQASDLIGRESRCSSQEPLWNCLLGLSILRDHILSHLHPLPLAGAYRRKYAFNRDLYQFMRLEKGGIIDPNTIRLQTEKNRRWKMTPEFKAQAQHFRDALPSQARLFFGLTPIPNELRGKNFDEERKQLLEETARLINANAILDLPASYPGSRFATTTHLNEHGRKLFTSALWNALKNAPIQ